MLWWRFTTISTRSIFFQSICPAECNVNGRCPGAMSSQPFFRVLTPAADELTGYHLTVTTRDSCSLPFARLAYIISFLRRLSRWPNASKKPKRFHMVKKNVKKPHASSRAAGCTAVGTKEEEPSAVYSGTIKCRNIYSILITIVMKLTFVIVIEKQDSIFIWWNNEIAISFGNTSVGISGVHHPLSSGLLFGQVLQCLPRPNSVAIVESRDGQEVGERGFGDCETVRKKAHRFSW